MVKNKMRVFETARVGPGDRMLFPFSFGPHLGFWLAFDAAAQLGCLNIPAGGMSTEARLQAIRENRISVLCCSPTYALRLGESAGASDIGGAPSSVRAIIVGGEPGGSIPAVVSRIESFWPGARVYDHHGMTEIGSVSYPCPQRQGVLHVIESSYVAEIIDPQNGHPAMLGATGELVLTNLGRTGSPLLRYRTGDLVRAESAGQCSCGSWDLALAGGILGRLDDMVVIRGVNVYPSAVEDIVRSFPDIADFRAEIRKRREMAELRLLIEPSAECPHPSELEALLQGKLRATLALRVSVDVVPVGTLPHFELKTNRWIRR